MLLGWDSYSGAMIPVSFQSVLQRSRGKRSNFGIIFHVTPVKCILCVTHHYNRLAETVLIRGHNICFI